MKFSDLTKAELLKLALEGNADASIELGHRNALMMATSIPEHMLNKIGTSSEALLRYAKS